MHSHKLSKLLVLVLILSCCVPSYYSAQFSSQIVEQLFIMSPNESQFRFPLFPSKIPFGLSSFSTSTAVLISFSQHQCLATAIATGACRRLAAVSVNTSRPKPNSITTTKTPILFEPTQVLREDIVTSQTAAVPLPLVQDFTLELHSVVVSSRVEPSTFMLD